MFDIGFFEVILVVVALLVALPREDFLAALRWMYRARARLSYWTRSVEGQVEDMMVDHEASKLPKIAPDKPLKPDASKDEPKKS